MRFDSRYAAYNMVAAMAQAAGLLPAVPEDREEDTRSGEPDASSGNDSSSVD